MKIISKIIWIILAIVVFLLALKNMHEGEIYFFTYEFKSPMVLILLGFLVAGFTMGVLAMTPSFFRQRRDLTKQRKTIDLMQKESQAQQLAQTQPPQPDTIVGA